MLVQLIQQLPWPAQLWKTSGAVVTTNARFNELFGLPPEYDWEGNGRRLVDDPQLDASGASKLLKRAFDGAPVEVHSVKYSLDQASENSAGQNIQQLVISLKPLFDGTSEVQFIACFISPTDNGDSRYEQELMRSQKMESMETLASGVAHEFNNIFTGIKGMTDLIRGEVDKSSEIYEFADTIQQNIKRGADLIQQLSSFAREVPYTLRRRYLPDYIQHVEPLLKLQVTKRIKLTSSVDAPVSVMLDANKMDQALANIVLNSRDAMGGNGCIDISVVMEAPPDLDCLSLQQDVRWVMIQIGDNGPGIPEELRAKVLEPFFSTKERGKATGLGLSVTSRIVASHRGLVTIGNSSELGGAAVKIYLPVAQEPQG